MKSILIIITTCVTSLILSQQKTVSIYFDFDKEHVKAIQHEKLKNTFKDNNYEVTLKGYADYFGTDDYNIKLSERRIESVKQELLKINPNLVIQKADGLGETQKFGDRKSNRKVDVVYTIKKSKIQLTEVKDTFEVVIDTPKREIDTSLYEIEKLEVGENFVLNNMEFIPGEHFLKEYAKPELEKLLNVLQKFPNIKIEIQGHICCETTNQDGLDWTTGEYKLSTNRARYIYEYLIDKGIDKNRLSYKGFGRTRPLVDETKQNPQRNRRVEIKVIEK